jgi:hypothetical protein
LDTLSIRRSAITEFCEKRGVPKNLRDAFGAYARSLTADRYQIRGDTDTVRLLINNMTEEQMSRLWWEFVSDLKKILPSEQSS